MVQVPRGKLGAFLRNELCVPCWHLHTHVCSDTGGRTGFAQRGIRVRQGNPSGPMAYA